jgi:hypothetical protein
MTMSEHNLNIILRSALRDTSAHGELLRSFARVARERCELFNRGEALFLMIRPLLPALVAEAERRGTPQEADKVSEEALAVLLEMHRALVPVWDPEKQPLHMPVRVHASGDVFPFGKGPYDGYAGGFDKDSLEAAAASYLARPWMAHDYLDWCLVDAMVRREWAAFDYAVRNPQSAGLPTPVSPLTKLLPWLIEGAIAATVVWWLRRSYTNDDPHFLWWSAAAAVYYGYFSVGIIRRASAIRSLRRRGDAEDPKVLYACILVVKMQQCYRELDGPVLSPTKVRDVLRSGESDRHPMAKCSVADLGGEDRPKRRCLERI